MGSVNGIAIDEIREKDYGEKAEWLLVQCGVDSIAVIESEPTSNNGRRGIHKSYLN